MARLKRRLKLDGDGLEERGKPCKGCGDEITGFGTAGYCEDCLCPDCGNTLDTENERAAALCEDCEMGQFDEDE
jgi:hypothetical protein